MRIVPENRLLIQPTVQLKWIEQHGAIEFQLSETDQAEFLARWAHFTKSDLSSLHDYLNTDEVVGADLFENDKLFALLTGADFIRQKYEQFQCGVENSRLVWRIERSSKDC